MTGIGRAARWTAAALAGLGGRDLAAVLAVVLIVAVFLCWVLRDEDRSRRLTGIPSAWRGTGPRAGKEPGQPDGVRGAGAAGWRGAGRAGHHGSRSARAAGVARGAGAGLERRGAPAGASAESVATVVAALFDGLVRQRIIDPGQA